MERYKNLGGSSGVDAYSIGDGEITVRFKDRMHYLYTDAVAGAVSVAEMQRLAVLGRGLNSYINKVVKKRWTKKWHG
jgi:hypothetical protein